MSGARPTIVRGGRIDCRNAQGGRSYLRVKGLLRYIAFGRRLDVPSDVPPRQRGVWLDHTGRPQPHEAVLRWAKDKVHRFGNDVSYQLLLSTRSGGLGTDDFSRALQRGSSVSGVYEWRVMVHDDTANQHAHAVLFRREPLTRAQYRAWQQAMQGELDRLQLAREQALQQAQAPPAGQERALPQHDGPELTL